MSEGSFRIDSVARAFSEAAGQLEGAALGRSIDDRGTNYLEVGGEGRGRDTCRGGWMWARGIELTCDDCAPLLLQCMFDVRSMADRNRSRRGPRKRPGREGGRGEGRGGREGGRPRSSEPPVEGQGPSEDTAAFLAGGETPATFTIG